MIADVSADGRLVFAGRIYRCALGAAGITDHKMEGDSATPRGLLPLRRVLYRADRIRPPPAACVPLEPLAPTDGWCDAPYDRAYNRPVSLPYDASHEALWRTDALYDVIGVLGWNDQPVERSRGSAIFLHVARPDYGPTAGCVALAREDLLGLLKARLSGVSVK